jgi:hypothetical protein
MGMNTHDSGTVCKCCGEIISPPSWGCHCNRSIICRNCRKCLIHCQCRIKCFENEIITSNKDSA